MEINHLEPLAKTFIIAPKQNQFIQENIFKIAPVRRIAIPKNTNSALTGLYTQNPFWYQQFDLRHIRILRRCQPIVDLDAVDNFRLYVTKMEPMSFQDDIPSIPIDGSEDCYVLAFDLILMQDATQKNHYPELVVEPLRL